MTFAIADRGPWLAYSDARIVLLGHRHELSCQASPLKLGADAGEDSFSILPILRGEKPAQPTHLILVHQALDGQLASRKGPWKSEQRFALKRT